MARKRIATFLGPNKGLSVLQSHAYAFSGLIVAHTDDQTALSFTTGNFYVVGYLQLNGAVDDDSPADVTLTAVKVSFNGQGLFILVTGNNVHRTSRSIRQKIIIPPLTEVIAIVDHEAIAADQYSSVVITGRVYDA